jgi:hypothetical protein
MYMMGAQGSGKVEEIQGLPQSLLKDDHKIYDGACWCVVLAAPCVCVCVCVCACVRMMCL